MRFRKAIALVSLLTLCFVLAPRSAKSATINTIVIDDLTDTITFTDATGRVGLPTSPAVPACGAANLELCALTLSAPPNATVASTTLLATFLLSEPGTFAPSGTAGNGCIGTQPLAPLGCVSDGFASVFTTPSLVTFTVHSDTEFPNAPCPAIQPTGVSGCNQIETGAPQLVGSVTWTDGTKDSIYLESDIDVVPEPASLILFGSGLVMVGEFLRRGLRSV
jgi:hypothetical protein